MESLKDLELKINIIIKRQNKRTYVRVKKPNIVEITTPKRLTNKELDEILLSSRGFIEKAINRINSKSEASGIHYLGKEYKLDILANNKNYIEIVDDTIRVYTRKNDSSYIKAIIYKELYGKSLKEIIEEELPTAKEALKISFPLAISLRDVKTYYGKCYFKEHKLIFAYMLAKYKREYIVSVIYHELAHFYYQNHQSGFYSLLEGVFPGYKKVQHELRMTKYNDIY